MLKRITAAAVGSVLGLSLVAALSGPAQSQSGASVVPMSRKSIVPVQQGVPETGRAPDGKGIGTLLQRGPSGQAGAGKDNGIIYHGGPLMIAPKNVYYIWYGDWSKNTGTSILTDFAQNIGGSPYFNINTSYDDKKHKHVQNAVSLAGSVTDNYSKGKSLSDDDVLSVVQNAMATGLPTDPNGVYFVLTSADVNETSGFCSQYCGWHNFAVLNNVAIKYSFVGNADQCPTACSAQTKSPNDNVGVDGMASVIAHELEEATTDPELDAWYSNMGGENGDLCAWKFGSMQSLPSGAKYNMTLGPRKFLIQQNWVNANGGYCDLSYH